MAAPTNLYIDGKLAFWFFRPHQPAQAATPASQGGVQQPAVGHTLKGHKGKTVHSSQNTCI
jgi:hypothetical protein